MKGKILLFVSYNCYPCIVGGAEIFNLHLINKLSKIYNTHRLTFCKKCESDDEVTMHYLKQLRFSKIIMPILVLFFLFKKRKNIKIVHFSYSEVYWTHLMVYVIAKKLFGIQYMFTVHNGSLSRWKARWVVKLFFKHAYKITGVSDRIVTEYSKRSDRDDIIFTPPLVPFNVITPRNKYRDKWDVSQDDKVLLYVGSLKPLKSVETLIEALGIISRDKLQQYKLKILIVGDGVYRKKLEDKVKDMKLQKNIKFLGNVRTEQVAELYNLADFYTICSEYEGLPISTLEAFANSIPCVTSNAPGLNHISDNENNTLMFEVRNAKDYANKIESLLSNVELQNKLKINGNEYYNNLYSYDKLVDKFKKIVDNV